MAERDVVILGSTGSIGTQALEIVRKNPGRFRVVALTSGGNNPELFAQQVAEFEPDYSGIGEDASVFAAGLKVHTVLNGMAGAVGLRPTIAALEAGNRLALANKESLIIGGPIVKELAEASQIVPVDSEHSAIAQCLRAGAVNDVRRLILTASGGPFRGRSLDSLRNVTPAQALAHPTWDMGPLVTINSATLVNKGLEVIEAHLLFGIPLDSIEVVVHPTSVVHSMVEFNDGSTIAQASPPTMTIPIALGLAWPGRVPGSGKPVNWLEAQRWEFFPLDDDAFPAVRIARQAAEVGGTAPAVFNAANEVAVAAFLAGELPFTQIVPTIQAALGEHVVSKDAGLTVEEVLDADAWARSRAADAVKEVTS